MRRLHFKSTSVVVLFLLFVLATLSITGVYFWKIKNLRDLKHILRLKEKRTFSILELMGSSNVFEVVMPNVSTILMEPRNSFLEETKTIGTKNETQTRVKRPFAVVLVTSMARYFNQRHVIRSTWYKWAEQLNIRVFFMIGFHDEGHELFEILQEEQRRHNDLIIDDFEEGYYKLPGKVLRMLKWYNSTYSDETAPHFFIKTDQDVFLNLPNIVASLKSTSYYKTLETLSNCNGWTATHHSNSNYSSNSSHCPISDDVDLPLDPSDPETYYVGGKRFENAEVEKDPDSKWYIDSNERERLNWPSALFPTYLNGPCYVMSGNVVKSVYETSFQVPLYPFEDVYIIGMIAYDRLNLFISNMDGMYLDLRYLCYVKKRSKLQKILAMHPVDRPSLMRKLCKKISSCHALMTSGGLKVKADISIVLTLIGLVLSVSYTMKVD